MKSYSRYLLFTLGLFLCFTARSQDPYSGNWVGVTPDGRLEIIFHIQGDARNGYTATWDSPIEKVLGLKCKTVSVQSDSIQMVMNGVLAEYHGALHAASDSIRGYWLQNGHQLSLDCKKMRRPQTPVPPFAYQVDSVEYDNADKTVHLGATLTKPAGGKKYPVAILITGSGLQDRDETIFEHRPFAIIADELTKRGIAVLRIDDRMKGKSKGDVKNASSLDFAADILTSIRYLATRPDIDTTRIGLIGHSEGGLIAPMVAVQFPAVRWIVLLAGPGVPGSEISLKQQMDAIGKMNFNGQVLNAYAVLTKNKMDTLNRYYGSADSLTLNALKIYFEKWKKQYPDSVLIPLGAQNATGDLFALQVAGTELKPWTRFFYKTDPADYLQKIKCPVLILNGEKDKQIYPDQNIPPIRSALDKAQNHSYSYLVLKGLNHLFQHCTTGDFYEYAIIDESFAPEALQQMGDWIDKHK